MSMQRIVNYGSFMQSYALKKTIELLKYNVVFVDYVFGNSIVKTDKTQMLKKIQKNANIFSFLKKRKYLEKFTKNYNYFIDEYLNVKNEKDYHYEDIDELVIGSDEVFNCLQDYPVGYSTELFGKNHHNVPIISYAGSFGTVNVDKIREYKIDKELSNLFNKFKTISVRDKNSFDIVNTLVNKDVEINVDPVIIYDFNKDIIDNVKLSNYIIVYAYNGRLTKEERTYIKRFAKTNNKKIVSIGSYQTIADYNLVVDPFEVFAYFKHADFIITDTFHGTIFSMKTHSNFATIVRDSNRNKLYDLLEKFNRTDRIVEKINDIDELYNKKIDYKETDEIIKIETKKSLDYLSENLIK